MWARLDDAILDNPKIIAAGPVGLLLHVAAITWCARNLTDGLIPKLRIRTLLPLDSIGTAIPAPPACGPEEDRFDPIDADEVADALATIGLWHDRGAYWELHDYLVYNPPRAKVLADREHARAKKAKQRLSPDVSPDVSPGMSPGDIGGDIQNVPTYPVPVPVSGSVPEENLSFASLTQGDGASPRPTELGFVRFWATYPKKRHKPAAARAWKAVDGARHLEAIVAGVECWKASEQWAGGRIEDPSTFLRQRQWEDAVPTAPASTGVEGMADRIRKKGLL